MGTISIFKRINKKTEMDNMSKIDHKHRLHEIRVMKDYAKEASEMTREELELAFVKCRFGRTSFARFSHIIDDDFDCK